MAILNYDCEDVFKSIGKSDQRCNNGSVTPQWAIDNHVKSNPAYQRKLVSDICWRQEIMRTVLCATSYGIPEIHLRVIEHKALDGSIVYTVETLDGQQRLNSITGFLNGDFALPEDMIVDGQEVGGLMASQLRIDFPGIYSRIQNYRISCKWYEGLSDIEASDIYINVLNNVTTMKDQEIRSAYQGAYSDYIRSYAQGVGGKIHEIFKRDEDGKFKYFSKRFPDKDRMESDEWLSELIYMKLNGVTKGVDQKQHTEWVKSTQADTYGKYKLNFTDKTTADKLLKFSLKILKVAAKEYRPYLSPMVAHMLILYADKLAYKNKVNIKKYVKSFFSVYHKWNSVDKPLFEGRFQHNGKTPMGQFKKLFGGRNSNAINTIFMILNEEIEKGEEDFGIIEVDQRVSFSRDDMVKKYHEQEGKCFYSGDPLTIEEMVGDHYIPRSWGIAEGGVTEYDNLVITTEEMNNRKSDMHGDEFHEIIRKERGLIAA